MEPRREDADEQSGHRYQTHDSYSTAEIKGVSISAHQRGEELIVAHRGMEEAPSSRRRRRLSSWIQWAPGRRRRSWGEEAGEERELREGGGRAAAGKSIGGLLPR